MSDLNRILKLAGREATVEETPSLAPEMTQREMKPVAQEAVGEFAEPLYTLQDDLGLEDNILVDELARWMSGQDIADFVADFRSDHDMNEADIDEADIDEADIDEDNAFNSAAAEAAKRGDSHFEFNGKKYPVKMDKKTADGLTDDIEHLRKLSGI
jgi:hypothetical protein